jgi:hypothetical protein
MNESFRTDSDHQRFGRLNQRKDARKALTKGQPVIAECQTEQLDFNGIVRDMSTGGIFIETKMPSSVGQEIAFQFNLPKSKQTVKATGVIVRKTLSGIGVDIKIIFRD